MFHSSICISGPWPHLIHGDQIQHQIVWTDSLQGEFAGTDRVWRRLTESWPVSIELLRPALLKGEPMQTQLRKAECLIAIEKRWDQPINEGKLTHRVLQYGRTRHRAFHGQKFGLRLLPAHVQHRCRCHDARQPFLLKTGLCSKGMAIGIGEHHHQPDQG